MSQKTLAAIRAREEAKRPAPVEPAKPKKPAKTTNTDAPASASVTAAYDPRPDVFENPA